MESHEAGLISMRIAFEGGALAEPAGKEGVAKLVSFMFNEGAGDMDTEALSSRRQSIGVDFAGWSDHTDVGISFSAPAVHRREAFALLRLALYAPRYDAAAIERGRREYAATLAAEQTQPGSVAADRLSHRQFGASRLAMPVYGSLASLGALTRDDLESFRNAALARSNMKIAVAGDIAPTELAPLLDELFGALPARAEVPRKPETPAQRASTDVIPMQIPQSIVMFGNAVPRLTWRQSLAFAVGNQVLSAPFTGRLFREVREKRGLVYGIQASLVNVARTSSFIVAFGAGPENVTPALDESRREIERVLAEGISAEEVAEAKEAFLGSFFLALDTNEKLVSQLLEMQRNGLPITYLDDYADEIQRLTVADVMAAVRMAIRPDITTVAIVGSAPDGMAADATASTR